jgi:hypothetical protein
VRRRPVLWIPREQTTIIAKAPSAPPIANGCCAETSGQRPIAAFLGRAIPELARPKQ